MNHSLLHRPGGGFGFPVLQWGTIRGDFFGALAAQVSLEKKGKNTGLSLGGATGARLAEKDEGGLIAGKGNIALR